MPTLKRVHQHHERESACAKECEHAASVPQTHESLRRPT
jgi:hypothetical protein